MAGLFGSVSESEELFEVEEGGNDDPGVEILTDPSDIDAVKDVPTGGLFDAVLGDTEEEELFEIEEGSDEDEDEEAEEGDSKENEDEAEDEAEDEVEDEVSAEEEQATTLEVLDELGIGLSKEDLETYGGDVPKAVAAHINNAANNILTGHLEGLESTEKDLALKLLNGSKLSELGFDGKVLTQYSYSDTEIEESEEVQRELVQAYYREVKGFSEAKAKKFTDASDDELLDDALLAKAELTKLKKEREEKPLAERKAAQKLAEEAQQKRLAAIQTASEDFYSKKTFGDFKLPKAISDKAKASMYENWEQIVGNLPKYLPLLSVLNELGVLDGKADKISASAINVGKKALTKLVNSKKKPTSVSAKKTEGNDVDDDMDMFKAALARKVKNKRKF